MNPREQSAIPIVSRGNPHRLSLHPTVLWDPSREFPRAPTVFCISHRFPKFPAGILAGTRGLPLHSTASRIAEIPAGTPTVSSGFPEESPRARTVFHRFPWESPQSSTVSHGVPRGSPRPPKVFCIFSRKFHRSSVFSRGSPHAQRFVRFHAVFYGNPVPWFPGRIPTGTHGLSPFPAVVPTVFHCIKIVFPGFPRESSRTPTVFSDNPYGNPRETTGQIPERLLTRRGILRLRRSATLDGGEMRGDRSSTIDIL